MGATTCGARELQELALVLSMLARLMLAAIAVHYGAYTSNGLYSSFSLSCSFSLGAGGGASFSFSAGGGGAALVAGGGGGGLFAATGEALRLRGGEREGLREGLRRRPGPVLRVSSALDGAALRGGLRLLEKGARGSERR